MISVKSLYSGYDKHQILHGVDLEVGKNITTIIGANGSGKSTILRSIVNLCDVYSGTILYDNTDITGISTHKLSKLGISYMAQTHNVFSELSVHENLIMAAHPEKPDLEYTFNMFEMLESYSTTKASKLSGGQRQLLAMAMMIQKKPQVCLYDEPTAALSPKNAKMILDKITQIQHDLQNCTVIVEQNVKAALGIADYCILVSSGTIQYAGDPQQLLDDESLGQKYLGLGP